MTLKISRVRKVVQTALNPKPQINPAIRGSHSGIENIGHAPVSSQQQDKFAAQHLFPHCTNSHVSVAVGADRGPCPVARPRSADVQKEKPRGRGF